MRIVVLIIVFLSSVNVHCQVKYDHNLIIGLNSGEDPGNQINMISYDDVEYTTEIFTSAINVDTYNGMISNAAGQLLFYTNGCQIAGADGQVLQKALVMNA